MKHRWRRPHRHATRLDPARRSATTPVGRVAELLAWKSAGKTGRPPGEGRSASNKASELSLLAFNEYGWCEEMEMRREPNRDRLQLVFVSAFELEPGFDVDKLRHREHVKWDSLGHITLVAAIEDEFGVELDADQLIDLDSFDSALRILRELNVNIQRVRGDCTRDRAV